ncbi:hypothetical protein KP509_06G019600 [Ceratopteris richardii]|uniref:Uncharacterized protein n=1 Tax=Ceratopteris richardii TaxID=49495 RepID=A0A8T2UKY9_CERRI|nr:hypothetical protein KP509_06G019600 [Ceratopteris richardii]
MAAASLFVDCFHATSVDLSHFNRIEPAETAGRAARRPLHLPSSQTEDSCVTLEQRYESNLHHPIFQIAQPRNGQSHSETCHVYPRCCSIVGATDVTMFHSRRSEKHGQILNAGRSVLCASRKVHRLNCGRHIEFQSSCRHENDDAPEDDYGREHVPFYIPGIKMQIAQPTFSSAQKIVGGSTQSTEGDEESQRKLHLRVLIMRKPRKITVRVGLMCEYGIVHLRITVFHQRKQKDLRVKVVSHELDDRFRIRVGIIRRSNGGIRVGVGVVENDNFSSYKVEYVRKRCRFQVRGIRQLKKIHDIAAK